MDGEQKTHSNWRIYLALVVFSGMLIIMFIFMARSFVLSNSKHAPNFACRTNFKLLSVAFRSYADDNGGLLPPMSRTAGQLMFQPKLLYPNYLSEAYHLVCPSLAELSELYDLDRKTPRSLIDDHSYYYLSHATMNEDEGMAFVEAYREMVLSGTTLSRDLSIGKDLVISQANRNVDRDVAEMIPILIEKPRDHTPHDGLVLYLSGHWELVRMGEKYPMTESFIAALESIDM